MTVSKAWVVIGRDGRTTLLLQRYAGGNVEEKPFAGMAELVEYLKEERIYVSLRDVWTMV